MNFLNVLLIAFALAMDAFAVSVSCGIFTQKNLLQNAIKAGLSFGIFQAGMTAIGWVLGFSFKSVIEPIDHWVAFVLLSVIGINMIKESMDKSCKPVLLDDFKKLLTLSIATSIDALAAGVSFSTLGVEIQLPSILIGLITMVLCFFGVFLGNRIKKLKRLGNYVDLLGGIILIGIGIKILIEHLT